MAVVNKYVSPNYNASLRVLDAAGQFGIGTSLLSAISVFVMTGDTVGSIYRLFKGIPSDAIVTSLQILNDAWTNCTSINIGLYGVLDFDGVGAVVGSGNQLVAAYNPSAGNPITAGWVDLLNLTGGPSIANRNAALWTLAAQAEYPPKFAAFDIAMATVTNSGTATPNMAFKLNYMRGV